VTAQAFILAAGLGTRMRPLTLHRPKPLVPVCGVTVLEQALALCLQHGLRSVIVNAHHLAEQVVDFCARIVDLDIHVQVERPEILGTGGGLRLAMPRLADPFAVVNGDVLCDGDLSRLLQLCRAPGMQASMLLRRAEDAGLHGIVALDEQGRVVQLTSLARMQGGQPVSRDTHFTGIHALRRAALQRVPAQGFACIVRSAYQDLVPVGQVAGLVHPGTWLDVGNPRAYLDASAAVLDGLIQLPLDPWSRVGLGLRRVGGELRREGQEQLCDLHPQARLVAPCWVGRGATIEAGAVLGPHAVVGAGCRVGAGARLESCELWDGCELPPGTRLQRAVVYDGGILTA